MPIFATNCQIKWLTCKDLVFCLIFIVQKLNKKLTKEKIGLNASFTVSNVFVVTKYSGQDPEVNGGIDNNFYPRPRVYSLNLTFDF